MKYRYTKIGAAIALIILAVNWFVTRSRPHNYVMVIVDVSPSAGLFPTNKYQRLREVGAVPWQILLKDAVECSREEQLSVKAGLFTISRVEKEYGSGNLNTVLVYTNCSFWRLTKLYSYGSGSNVTYVDLLEDRASDRLILSPAILRSPIRVTVALFQQGRVTLQSGGRTNISDTELRQINITALRETLRFTGDFEQLIVDYSDSDSDAQPWVEALLLVRERLKLDLFNLNGERWIERSKARRQPSVRGTTI